MNAKTYAEWNWWCEECGEGGEEAFASLSAAEKAGEIHDKESEHDKSDES